MNHNFLINWPTTPAPAQMNQPNQTQQPETNVFNLSGRTNLLVNQNLDIPDNFILNENSSGMIRGADLTDTTFTYTTVGTKNADLIGGSGANDTFSLRDLNAAEALTFLKEHNYTFIVNHNGFSLRTADGQRINVSGVENFAFKDTSFDLTNETEASALLQALRDNDIPIHDERMNQPQPGQFVPVYVMNNSFWAPNANYVGAQQGLMSSNAYAFTNTTMNASADDFSSSQNANAYAYANVYYG
jgi:hypothetical protein